MEMGYVSQKKADLKTNEDQWGGQTHKGERTWGSCGVMGHVWRHGEGEGYRAGMEV